MEIILGKYIVKLISLKKLHMNAIIYNFAEHLKDILRCLYHLIKCSCKTNENYFLNNKQMPATSKNNALTTLM